MKAEEQDVIKRWENKLCRESKSLEAMTASLCGYGYYDRNGVPKEAVVKYLKMGAEWQKEQMMKDSISGKVKHCIRYWIITDENELQNCLKKFVGGDKVKVIIVKED
jgi:hypothetical protein